MIFRWCTHILALALLPGWGSLHAQDSAGAAKVMAKPPVQFTAIVGAQTVGEIDERIDQIKKLIERAEARNKQAAATLSTVELRIQTKEKEIELLEANIDAAEEEKRESEAASLEGQKRIAEKVKEMLKKERSLAGAEVDASQAEQAYGAAMEKALDIEMELAKKRLEIKEMEAEGGVVARALARDLEGRVMQARIEASKKNEAMVAGETEVLEQLEGLYLAQNELGAGR